MDDELSPTAIAYHRRDVLLFASALTVDRSDPAAVTANAIALQEWMEQGNADDQRNRNAALQRAHANRDYSKREPDNRPDLLIREAKAYYTFLTAV